jgi:hypothetical protein
LLFGTAIALPTILSRELFLFKLLDVELKSAAARALGVLEEDGIILLTISVPFSSK